MFKKFFDSHGRAQDQQDLSFQAIDLFDELMAHKSLKKRLHEYLDGLSKEKLEPGQIGIDHDCGLGKWLHNEAKAHLGEQTVFIKLVDEHAKFHACAAQVVEAHRGGNSNLALEILNGRFLEQDTRFVNCLTKFNAVVEAYMESREAV